MYFSQVIQSLLIEKENYEKTISDLRLDLNNKNQKITQLQSFLQRNKINKDDDYLKPLNTESNLPSKSNQRYILFENENTKKVTKKVLYDSIIEKNYDSPQFGNMFIEKITTLNNFKVGMEKFQFSRVGEKDTQKIKIHKHIKGKKSFSQQPVIRPSKIENNLVEMYSNKSKLLGNKIRNSMKKSNGNNGGASVNAKSNSNVNYQAKDSLKEKLENNSLSLSKVTLRNELNFNSEIEDVDNLININENNNQKDNKFETEDTLMLTQIHDLIVNNKQSNKNVNLNKFIDNSNKPNKNVQQEQKDYNKFINIQTIHTKNIKNATLENELNKLFDKETVEIYNNIYKENNNCIETNNVQNIIKRISEVNFDGKKKSSSVIKEEKRFI